MNNSSLIEEKALKLVGEILKTGRRMGLSVKLDPNKDTINVDEFVKIKEQLGELGRQVYENTQTEMLLER